MHHKGGPLPVNDKENNGRLFANINMEPNTVKRFTVVINSVSY